MTNRTVSTFIAVGVVITIGCGREGARRAADSSVKLGGPPTQRTREWIAIGDNLNTSGNSYGHGVSDQFGETELRRLYLELNGQRAKSKLRSYICPAPLPPFTVTVVLWFEGSYQERLVRMQMTPPLYKENGAIEGGIGYLFEQTVKKLDKGPPIDYGYVHPLDGSKAVPPPEIDLYEEPEVHNCDHP